MRFVLNLKKRKSRDFRAAIRALAGEGWWERSAGTPAGAREAARGWPGGLGVMSYDVYQQVYIIQ